MEAVLLFAQAEGRAAAHHIEAVFNVHLQQLQEAQRLRLAVHQGDVVDAEGIFHGRVAVQLLEDGVGIEAVLQLDDQAEAVIAVREVNDVADAGQLLGVDEGSLLKAGRLVV